MHMTLDIRIKKCMIGLEIVITTTPFSYLRGEIFETIHCYALLQYSKVKNLVREMSFPVNLRSFII